VVELSDAKETLAPSRNGSTHGHVAGNLGAGYEPPVLEIVMTARLCLLALVLTFLNASAVADEGDVRGILLTLGVDRQQISSSMTVLDLKGKTVTDHDLSRLTLSDTFLKHIKSLALKSTNVTEVGLGKLLSVDDPQSAARTLESLDLSYTPVRDPNLLGELLKKLPQLTSLTLSGVGIDNDGLRELNLSGVHLKSLDLSFNRKLTGDSIGALVGAGVLGGLERLDLSETNIDASDLYTLPSDFKPKYLGLAFLNVSDENLSKLVTRRYLDKIETLNIAATQISDKGLEALHKLTNLKKLIMWRNKVTDEGMIYLSAVPNLESLNVKFTFVTARGKDALVARNNRCNVDF
jgi:hypothetical protein